MKFNFDPKIIAKRRNRLGNSTVYAVSDNLVAKFFLEEEGARKEVQFSQSLSEAGVRVPRTYEAIHCKSPPKRNPLYNQGKGVWAMPMERIHGRTFLELEPQEKKYGRISFITQMLKALDVNWIPGDASHFSNTIYLGRGQSIEAVVIDFERWQQGEILPNQRRQFLEEECRVRVEDVGHLHECLSI